jgi:CRP-like cAMP-binding protein
MSYDKIRLRLMVWRGWTLDSSTANATAAASIAFLSRNCFERVVRNVRSIESPNRREASFWPLHLPGQNHLLRLLPEQDRERALAAMQRIKTRHGQIVFERNAPITHVDFPLFGIISIVVEMEEGGIAEVGTVGNEGMAGVPLLLGADRTLNKAFYQVPGESMRMSAQAFREEIAPRGPFENIMRLHAQGFLNQVSQSTACNRLHAVEQRLCRWILMSHDRVGGKTVHLTQDFLAQMLGVRRASVSVVAATLQKAGFIRYRRGIIDVLDRAGLEEGTCECYDVVRKEYERLLC